MMPRTLCVANRRPGTRRPPAKRGALAPRAIRSRGPQGGTGQAQAMHLLLVAGHLPRDRKGTLLESKAGASVGGSETTTAAAPASATAGWLAEPAGASPSSASGGGASGCGGGATSASDGGFLATDCSWAGCASLLAARVDL